ncbi:MAG: hypothetical protein CMK23_07175 [Porticoccaceae bacterium]|jgi:hypothetical protein|nr:hypothetical protein [Porticoccaceae bacterium]|tara:strand:- start:13481 stop:13714 length:234 start_codon:yes stop_codon:yes gene_type:complete
MSQSSEIVDYLRDPASAAVIAACTTAAYIHFKAKINNEGPRELVEYAKPAALVGILVYVIVSNGMGQRETISTEPFR